METLSFLLTTSFYPPHFVGGDAMHVKYLADLLTSKGHEVTVLFNAHAAKWKGVYNSSATFQGKERLEAVTSRSWRRLSSKSGSYV